jgi:hypothetical protein
VLAMKLDLEKYLPMADRFDMSLAQKEEMIRTIWGLMESCVDQAFGVHTVQNISVLRQKALSQSAKRGIESKRISCKKAFNRAAKKRAA